MAENQPLTVAEKLGQLPRRPGVYLMKDQRGKILYVGKAVDLRQRVRWYFQSSQKLSPKVRALVEKIHDLDYTVTDTEVEALILESNLIKEYRPRYNIDLKDDKQYPYLRVTLQEPFPRIHVARRVEKDGARYFGPFTNAGAVKETIRLIRRLFPLRHCRGPVVPRKERRPCLNHHIQRCLAPCSAEVTREDYRKVVDEIILFLEGKQDKLLRELAVRMAAAAENLEFEKAAQLRDQYRAVEAITEKQKIVATAGGERDIIAMAAGEDAGCAQLFAVRGGKLTGREHFLLTNPTGEGSSAMLAAFLHRFYHMAGEVPSEILLSETVPDPALMEAWLGKQKGGRVRLHVPQRGAKKELVRLALDNAVMFLEQEVLREKTRNPLVALSALADTIGLDNPPLRIEGYDVSHLHGEGTVASMVVFEQGMPLPPDYRRFHIRSVDRPDDYAAMKEVLIRRFTRFTETIRTGEKPINITDPFLLAPDLILIDGGLGQLNAALSALSSLGLTDFAIISLAKEEELIFLPGKSEPLRLPKHVPALQLLQRIRDEAHRFAVTLQRKQRSVAKGGSFLLEVPGIGEKRRKALLLHFGSFAAIRRASAAELAVVSGMNAALAANLYAYLQDNHVQDSLN